MKKLVMLIALLCVPRLAAAQALNDPTTLTFAPSPDHATLVTSYVLTITGPASKTVDIGKPTPASNAITYTALRLATAGMPSCPVVGSAVSACYSLTVQAKGDGGLSAAAPGNASFSLGALSAPRAIPGAVVIR